ncbi:XRE family transcriptional regulator [Muribacter muris]|uniref:XRE family transcriptional regulator n=1 Tax=Muribacter muris TaxID=67855 RepID=A0A4Y9K8Q4_9PAST|nr:helix-turn-helix transcriptional regulator [Muribacter muris]MBF0784286.1 helix-turn-helix transcriptional regulator [Muribacter muris]MBF0826976.1 helix-turn-helix transcriptional regulator [Muribacter muris]TFV13025.1 XRE family transcriptional regulator [Muribacter muris]
MSELNQKIKILREINQWSQEEMAEKMNMSLNSYARLERGETKLNIEKLEQIANVFNMDIFEFMQPGNKGFYVMLNDADNNKMINYASNDSMGVEIEKLNLIIKHKDEIIKNKDELLQQKQNEIASLKQIIELIKG